MLKELFSPFLVLKGRKVKEKATVGLRLQENPVPGQVLGSVYGRNTIYFIKILILYFLLSIIMQDQKQHYYILTNRMENLHLFLCYSITFPNPQPKEKTILLTQMSSNTWKFCSLFCSLLGLGKKSKPLNYLGKQSKWNEHIFLLVSSSWILKQNFNRALYQLCSYHLLIFS